MTIATNNQTEFNGVDDATKDDSCNDDSGDEDMEAFVQSGMLDEVNCFFLYFKNNASLFELFKCIDK